MGATDSKLFSVKLKAFATGHVTFTWKRIVLQKKIGFNCVKVDMTDLVNMLGFGVRFLILWECLES